MLFSSSDLYRPRLAPWLADDIARLMFLSRLKGVGGWVRNFSLIRAAGMLEGLWTLGLEASLRGVVSRPTPGPVRREPGVSRVCVHTDPLSRKPVPLRYI